MRDIETTIYKNRDVKIKKYISKDFVYLSYITYEDDNLFFSKKIADVAGVYYLSNNINIGVLEIEKVEDSLLCEIVLETYLPTYQTFLKKGVDENNILTCITLHEKTDLARQYMKLALNSSFGSASLYELSKHMYQVNENDAYFDMALDFMKSALYGVGGEKIKSSVSDELSDFIDEDGFLFVYRGFNKFSREDGVSFTLKKEVADFFARRWDSDGEVRTYNVHIDNVIAFLGNGELEIVTENAIEV